MPMLGKFESGRNLAQLFMLAFFSLSLAVLLVSSSLQLAAHFQAEKNALFNNQRLVAEGASRAVSGFVQENCRALATAAWMTNPDTATPAHWQLDLQRLLGLQPAYRRLSICGLDGHRLSDVSRYAPTDFNSPRNEGENPLFSQLPHVVSAPAISDVYIDPVTCEPLIGIRIPVLNALREIKLTLTAEVNLKFMWDLVDHLKVGQTGYAYVVDRMGNLLAFGDTARVLKGENVARVPTVAEFIQNPARRSLQSAKIYRGIADSFVVGTYVPLDTPQWAIVTELPWTEAFREIMLTALISLIIIGAMATISAFAGAAMSRRLTARLVALQETATRIAQGERELLAKVEGPEEVARLASAFNSMAFQLQQSLKKLENRYKEVLAGRDALKASEERLRLAQEATRDGIWDYDLATERVYFSPRWYRMLSYEPDEFPASYEAWASLVHEGDRKGAEMEVRKAIASHEAFSIEFRMIAKDGNWRWIQSRGKAVAWDSAGNAVRLAGAHSDLTERKEAEKEKASLEAKLVQSQKMEAVGLLAGGIAHDFNNMLSVVVGNTELAMLKLDRDNPLYRNLNRIHGAAHRSGELVRQLLAFARKQTTHPKVLNVNATVSAMLKMLKRLIGEDIDLVWKPRAELEKIRIDPGQIDQVLVNLMINARDAIAGVGKITIETDGVVFDKAYCDSHPGFTPGRFVLLAFSDDGCGMDDATMKKAFDPFFTTKAVGRGTGLGLSTVYGIVKQNEGFINVYSEVGKGTTFRIYLPAIDTPETATDTKPVEPIPAGTGTILMVEDDGSILELGQTVLEQLGYNVLATGTPEQAIELVRGCNGKIDLLITDVVMPQMNGRELANRLGRFVPGLKTLYMSGYTANVIAHHGVLDPGINFLQKPFSIQEIAVKVREVIGQPSE